MHYNHMTKDEVAAWLDDVREKGEALIRVIRDGPHEREKHSWEHGVDARRINRAVSDIKDRLALVEIEGRWLLDRHDAGEVPPRKTRTTDRRP